MSKQKKWIIFGIVLTTLTLLITLILSSVAICKITSCFKDAKSIEKSMGWILAGITIILIISFAITMIIVIIYKFYDRNIKNKK